MTWEKSTRRKGPRVVKVILDLDTSFFTNSHFHPSPSRNWPPNLEDVHRPRFGPVRILNGEGTCVRVISVDELLSRPKINSWNRLGQDTSRRPPKRSVKTKVVRDV